ncbi:MAG: hemin uptake protein HemP [Isosphaera sp.]|nr:hemin uptake protein HemP [Isosphaera sp.]
MSDHDTDDRDGGSDDGGAQKVVRAEELFGESREIWIELDGVRYRLRITRRGKLILQK